MMVVALSLMGRIFLRYSSSYQPVLIVPFERFISVFQIIFPCWIMEFDWTVNLVYLFLYVFFRVVYCFSGILLKNLRFRETRWRKLNISRISRNSRSQNPKEESVCYERSDELRFLFLSRSLCLSLSLSLSVSVSLCLSLCLSLSLSLSLALCLFVCL